MPVRSLNLPFASFIYRSGQHEYIPFIRVIQMQNSTILEEENVSSLLDSVFWHDYQSKLHNLQ